MTCTISINKIENYGTLNFCSLPKINECASKTVPVSNAQQSINSSEKDAQINQLRQQKELLNTTIKELKNSNEELQRILLEERTNKTTIKDVCFINETTNKEENKENNLSNDIEPKKDIKCSNELIAAYQAMQEGNLVIPMEIEESNEFIDNLNEEELSLLHQWTGKQKLHVFFNNKKERFTRENCLSILKNKTDIIILLETENGEVFGSYHHLVPQQFGNWVNDPKHFVFAIRNKNKIQGKYEADSNNHYSLMIADFMEDDDELKSTILEIGYFYTITLEEICSLNMSFNSHYLNTPNIGVDAFMKEPMGMGLKSILFIE
ncbi:hypothetical protein, conserved [Entamoeba histolytica]